VLTQILNVKITLCRVFPSFFGQLFLMVLRKKLMPTVFLLKKLMFLYPVTLLKEIQILKTGSLVFRNFFYTRPKK
jgi:hypothetical protein